MPENGNRIDDRGPQRPALRVIDPSPGATANLPIHGTVQFDLQTRPSLAAWRENVRVNVYPQDPFVDQPVLRSMPVQELREGVVNDRFRIRDSRGIVAQPDTRGDYIFHPEQDEFDQINALYYATLALRMCENYAGRPLPWSFGAGQILIDPCVGTTVANAYYNETDRVLGFFTFKLNGEEIHASQSSDIVTHEVGHAILDGMRDLLNVSFSFGPEAFHEAFCDMVAILVALHDNGLIERVLADTENDLKTESFLSYLAEALGKHHNAKDPRTANVFYLRNALNNLLTEPFDLLPYLPKNRVTGLGREAHSFSRVYTGALYNILVAIYEQHKKQKWAPAVALGMARDIVGELLVRSVELGPVAESSFEDFAWAMIMADRIFMQGKYEKILSKEFRARRILTPKKIAAFEAKFAKPPDLMLPEFVNDTQSAEKFLEANRGALGLPDRVTFSAQGGYRDRYDNRFLTYRTVRPVKLDGAEFLKYAGQTVPLYGGITMMFDASGVLRNFTYRAVEDEDVKQARKQIADMLAAGHLAFSISESEQGLGMLQRTAIITLGTDRKPTTRVLTKIDPDYTPTKKKLTIPVLDQAFEIIRVSMQVMDQPKIKEYAQQWLKVMNPEKSRKKSPQ